MGNVHICEKTRAVHLTSVFDDFGILVFCSQFQLVLLLHVAVSSHRTQVASVDRQQHHRGGKNPVADVCHALPRHHDEDPEGTRSMYNNCNNWCVKSSSEYCKSPQDCLRLLHQCDGGALIHKSV